MVVLPQLLTIYMLHVYRIDIKKLPIDFCFGFEVFPLQILGASICNQVIYVMYLSIKYKELQTE